MSDKDLEKLAAAMKNISPSDAARERGMAAAMSAFEAQFASEAASDTAAAGEESLESSQGFTAEPRPTGQTTRPAIRTGRVQTFGRAAVTKLNKIFDVKPQALMMGGSCMAALIAGVFYLQPGTFDMQKQFPGEPDIVGPAAPDIAVSPPVEDAPDVDTPPAIKAATEAPTVDEPAVIIKAPAVKTPVVKAPVAVAPEKPSAPKTAAITETPPAASEPAAAPQTPSNVVVLERRIMKTPARTVERAAPAVTKTETRRVVKTPAATQERVVPAITKRVDRRVEAADGSFETVSETVVVTPQSVEYITVPPVYETVTETVVVQEASTELVTVPAEFETVRETIRINADGSSDVLSSETVSVPSAPKSAGEITSVNSLLSKPSPAPKRASKAYAAISSETASARVPGYAAGSPARSKPAPEIADEIVVTGRRAGRKPGLFSRKKREDKVAPSAPAPARAPVETAAPMSADAPRLIERAIPAVTKQVARRVVKTPASVRERVTPAITKDVTVKIENADGTFTEVTKTFVIQPAGTELVAVPSTYETVMETVVVKPATVEYVYINPDGSIVRPPVKPKPKPVPQSGILTAGDYDDVLNPDLYNIYLNKMLQGQLRGKDLPYVDADKRVAVRVIDTLGKAVPMADISYRNGLGQKRNLKTGADGMAYLYPDFDSLDSDVRIKVSAGGARAVRKRLTRKVLRSGEIVIDLDTDSRPVQAIDLLLTIDSTGSMGDEMRYLQSELKSIVGRVEQANPGVNIRTGLVVYRDIGDDYVVREIPFTDDIEAFKISLGKQRARGGGDSPEAMHTAMDAGLDMAWRDDALKINLLVADAPPHDKHIKDTWNAALKSRREGIHIVPLAGSGIDKTAEFIMRSMAQITGGRYLFLTDDSGVGNRHAKPTVDCYVVTRLDGLVTRVLNSLITGERVEPDAGDIIRSVGNYRAGTCAVDEQDRQTLVQNSSYAND